MGINTVLRYSAVPHIRTGYISRVLQFFAVNCVFRVVHLARSARLLRPVHARGHVHTRSGPGQSTTGVGVQAGRQVTIRREGARLSWLGLPEAEASEADVLVGKNRCVCAVCAVCAVCVVCAVCIVCS